MKKVVRDSSWLRLGDGGAVPAREDPRARKASEGTERSLEVQWSGVAVNSVHELRRVNGGGDSGVVGREVDVQRL